MKPLRVCLDARIAPQQPGGLEQVVIGMASGLSSLAGDDEQYLFLVNPESKEWLRQYIGGPCQLLEASPPPPSVPSGRIRIRQLPAQIMRRHWRLLGPQLGQMLLRSRLPRSDGTIEAAGIQVMHFLSQSAFVTTVPSIYHPHDLQHLHLPQFFTPFERAVRETLYRTFCDRASLIAVTASWGKSDLVRHYSLPAEKIAVVPWAPVLSSYPEPEVRDIADVRSKFALPEHFAFYPAQTWPHKNHIGLLEAVAALRDEQGISVPFIFSGRRNEFFPTIEQRIRELGLDDQVKFIGFISPIELQSIYRLCRCIVIPTTFEAASFPLWEAFLAGVPVACSNVTSLPEQAGDAALLFDPSSRAAMMTAIIRLWSEPQLRQELTQRGRSTVSRFTWDRTVRTFRGHYRRLAGRALSDEDRYLLSSTPLL